MNLESKKIQSPRRVILNVSNVLFVAAKNGRCLFLKNVPYNATKEDIRKIFRKAIDVRFPGGTQGPKKGWVLKTSFKVHNGEQNMDY